MYEARSQYNIMKPLIQWNTNAHTKPLEGECRKRATCLEIDRGWSTIKSNTNLDPQVWCTTFEPFSWNFGRIHSAQSMRGVNQVDNGLRAFVQLYADTPNEVQWSWTCWSSPRSLDFQDFHGYWSEWQDLSLREQSLFGKDMGIMARRLAFRTNSTNNDIVS